LFEINKLNSTWDNAVEDHSALVQSGELVLWRNIYSLLSRRAAETITNTRCGDNVGKTRWGYCAGVLPGGTSHPTNNTTSQGMTLRIP
jgi:hypothetical protein